MLDSGQHNMVYMNNSSLGNTLTKTLQSVPNHFAQIDGSHRQKDAKSGVPTSNQHQLNAANNYRLDTTHLLQGHPRAETGQRSKKESKYTTVAQTIEKEEDFFDEFSPVTKPQQNEAGETSNSRNRAKSMLYSKAVPVGKLQDGQVSASLVVGNNKSRGQRKDLGSLEHLKTVK